MRYPDLPILPVQSRLATARVLAHLQRFRAGDSTIRQTALVITSEFFADRFLLYRFFDDYASLESLLGGCLDIDLSGMIGTDSRVDEHMDELRCNLTFELERCRIGGIARPPNTLMLTRDELFLEVARRTGQPPYGCVIWIRFARVFGARSSDGFDDHEQFRVIVGRFPDDLSAYIMLERPRAKGRPFATIRADSGLLDQMLNEHAASELVVTLDGVQPGRQSHRQFRTADGRELNVLLNDSGLIAQFSLGPPT